MKINKRQIETGLVNKIENSAEKAAQFVQHAADTANPHVVTAAQTGAYTSGEVDAIAGAVANQTYGKAYWFGRKFSETPWPLPEESENWEEGDRNGFDFATGIPWEWDGLQWAEGSPVELINGIIIGISAEFLDIHDYGFPGLARYSALTESWDYFPNRENTMDRAVFEKNFAGQETIKGGAILPEHLAESVTRMLFDLQWPVGKVYEQKPGDLSPEDMNWPGDWRPWNDRASEYRLTQVPIPAHTVYTPGANYAINSVVMWHLVTESGGDDWGYFKANRTITNAAEQLDPVMWDQLKTGVVVERKNMLDVNPWLADDLLIGQQIEGGEYDGYWVEEIIVYGGKFFAGAGGNRPTFVSGGVGGKEKHTLTIEELPSYPIGSNLTVHTTGGGYGHVSGGMHNYGGWVTIPKTGGDQPHPNIPPCVGVLYWRRIA